MVLGLSTAHLRHVGVTTFLAPLILASACASPSELRAGSAPSAKPAQAGAAAAHGAAHDAAPQVTSDRALAAALDGNRRFRAGHALRPHSDTARVHELATGQHPAIVVVGCADSRTSPEILLDQGLGDVFAVRVAGNVLEPAAIGSIEYATEHLGSTLVLILAHSRCGAVKAALQAHGVPGAAEKLGPNLKALVERIDPALASLPEGASDEKRLVAAVDANARLVAKELLARSEILRRAVQEHRVAVVAAVYELDDGGISILRESPGAPDAGRGEPPRGSSH